MSIAGSVASFIGMFILMIATALLLRRRGVLRSELHARLVWSFWKLPTSGMGLDVVFGASRMIGASLPFVTAMIVGLSLEKLHLGKDFGVLAAGALLALIVEPWIAEQLLNVYPVDQQTRLITVLFSAIPATLLGVVLAVRYGGDVSLASKLATFTLIMSAVSLPLTALLQPRL